MRGFLLGAMVLIGLEVALTAPGSRITALVALPAGWLAEWMDPARPLIGPGKLASSTSSTSSTPGSPSSALSAITGGAASIFTGGVVP